MTKVTLTDHHPQIFSMLQQRASIFVRQASEEMVTVSTPNTPMKTGRLRQDVIRQTLGLKGTVVWGKDYAAKMEEMAFRKYTTPGTGKDFAKKAAQVVADRTAGIAKISQLI